MERSYELRSTIPRSSRQIQELAPQSNESLLNIYALYKQASSGDVSGPKPGGFDFKGKAKYEAWSKLAGTSKEKAMEDYVALITAWPPNGTLPIARYMTFNSSMLV